MEKDLQKAIIVAELVKADLQSPKAIGERLAKIPKPVKQPPENRALYGGFRRVDPENLRRGQVSGRYGFKDTCSNCDRLVETEGEEPDACPHCGKEWPR